VPGCSGGQARVRDDELPISVDPPPSRCYDPTVPFALLYIVLGIIAFYMVAGVLRWLRQTLQDNGDDSRS
jgi:hypothetical protein